MSVYVKIKRLNGRQDHANLGSWLNQSGVIEVDYFDGGWTDSCIRNVYPHLKFEREEDAVAYVLANGGLITKSVPEVDVKENNVQ